jgi:hypothetical protein
LTLATLALVAFLVSTTAPMAQSSEHFHKCLVPDPRLDWARGLGAVFFVLAGLLVPAAIADYRIHRQQDRQVPPGTHPYLLIGAVIIMIAATIAGIVVLGQGMNSGFCDLG